MKNRLGFLIIFGISLLVLSFSCKKESGKTDPQPPDNDTTSVSPFAPKAVTKTNTKKVFAHMMPWFETKTSNGGLWGIHWKMNTQNPDIIEADGQRQIASNYYPMIGPYASGDSAVIQYQLLLMKLSGIDGVFIDWPGTLFKYDYPMLVKNTEKIVSQLARVGLEFAIVYEDQNLVQTSDQLGQAKLDMTYLQTKYFGQANYAKINGKPLLLDFGPQIIQNGNDWTTIFSVLNPKPSFFTLWFESNDAGTNTTGEFAWIPQNHLTTLNSFYGNGYSGIKMSSAYPGFNSFYKEGGWGGPTWVITANGTATFGTTLDLALAQSNIQYLQLATWNDYGEGTMIEPTKEFGYGFLTMLQEKLGVKGITETQLKMIDQFYNSRVKNEGNIEAQKQLNQVFDYIVSLQLDKAAELLAKI